LNSILNQFNISVQENSHFYFTAKINQITAIIPEFYIFVLIVIGLVFLLVIGIYIRKRRKRLILGQIYLKLSDFDKQLFHAIRATENQTKPTLKNLASVFYSIDGIKIENKRLLQHLYRLENVGLVNVSVTNWKGEPVQVCKSLYSDHPISEFIFKRYRLFLGLFLPISIVGISLCYYLLQFVDLIVHGDLYEYGLVFSYEWANQYWNLTASIRTFYYITLVLMFLTLIFTLANFRNFRNSLKMTSGVFFIITISSIFYTIFLLLQLDFLINYDLYNYGLSFTYLWAERYWTFTGLIFILSGLSIVASIICFIFSVFAKPFKT
jgi:hypothetical protein